MPDDEKKDFFTRLLESPTTATVMTWIGILSALALIIDIGLH